MQKAMILAMVLALAAVAAPALAEAGCSGAADAPFLAEAAPALATPVVTAKAPGAADQGPLLLSDSCTDQCQQGYRQCLVICSKNPCLISCEDQRCYCLQGCGSGCHVEES